jgi:dolichyl-phosphate-mannose--protein O-mannosyl transferase
MKIRLPLFFALGGVIISMIGLAIQNKYNRGEMITYGGLLLLGIFWIWSILDVVSAHDLRRYQKMFWLIITVSVPAMGGLLFYLMHQKPDRIVT